MSIDMQFSLLSNDLDTAKSTSAKARSSEGGCGDKGFGDVFDEQLQQANDANPVVAGAVSTANQQPKGQEVATLPAEPSKLAAAEAETDHRSQLLAPDLADQYVTNNSRSADLPADETTEQATSLFQLIAKSRDYAAELEPVVKDAQATSATANSAQVYADSAADTTFIESVLDEAALLEQLHQAKNADAKTNAEQANAQSAGKSDLSGVQKQAEQQLTRQDPMLNHATGQNAVVNDDAANGAEQQAQLQLSEFQQGKSPSASTSAGTELHASQAQLAGSVQVEADAYLGSDASQKANQDVFNSAQAVQVEHAVTNTNEQKAATLASEAVAGQTLQQSAQAAKITEQAAAQLSAANISGQDVEPTAGVLTESPQLTEQAQLAAALLAPAPASVSTTDKNNVLTPAFAEFQKSANAALAQQQKLQQKNEAQYAADPAKSAVEASMAETVAGALNLTYQDGVAVPVLSAGDKMLAPATAFNQAGSQSGSQSGTQQHSSFSQILAARQNDAQIQTQPSLSLLEPNAASQLRERVMYQVNQKIQSAEIRLTPEELGSVQIKINLQQEQLSVQFVVQQSAAKEALEQQMPRLKELLQEQGMALTDGQVHQQQSEQQQSQHERRTAGRGVTSGNAVAEDESVQQVQVAVSDRMVDYYA